MPPRSLACVLLAFVGLPALAAEPDAPCAKLAMDYAYHWDRFDGAGVSGLFTPEGTLKLGSKPMQGREAIAARVAGGAGKTTIRHLVSNIRVTPLDEKTAETVSYVQVISSPTVGAEGKPVPHPGGVLIAEYHDRCVKTGEGWRLEARTLVPVFTPPPKPATP